MLYVRVSCVYVSPLVDLCVFPTVYMFPISFYIRIIAFIYQIKYAGGYNMERERNRNKDRVENGARKRKRERKRRRASNGAMAFVEW